MKTQLLTTRIKLGFVLFHLAALPTFAQQIPNGNFESWLDFGVFAEPQSFNTLNKAYFGNPEFASRVAGYQSTYALQVSTLLKNGEYIVGGAVSNDNPISNTSKIPTSLTGYYKCNLVGKDSAYIFVSIDEAIDNYYYGLGGGNITLRGVVNTYTKFSFPITMDKKPGNYPVSYIIGIQSTHQDIKIPSGPNTVTVDALAFDFATSLEDGLLNTSTIIVSSDQQNISLDRMPSGPKEIHLLNLNGQPILTHATSGNKVEMVFPSLAPGLYLIKLHLLNTQEVKTLKVFLK